MIQKLLAAAAASVMLAAPVFSQTATAPAAAAPAATPAAAPTGDVEAGAKAFNKCQTCHVIANEAGEVLAGKSSKTGPNLYAMPGRVAGTYPDFKYGKSIVALGATGFVWDEANFIEYLNDPNKFLKTKLDDSKAKSNMVFKITKEEEARDLWAFISSLAPKS